MDEQALLGLNPNADPPHRERALLYFEQLKESQDGWQVCADALAKGLYSDDHVKFFCFQVLEHQIKFRHPVLSVVQQQLIRESLMKWLQTQLVRAEPEKSFIRNKAAQVLALTFVREFLTLWPEFFQDLLGLVGLNPHGVDLYLRTLLAIDAEVVDRNILHSPEETRRNALIKDSMREQVVPSLVESWFQILTRYQRTHPEITCRCLEVVGAFVSWIDLSLIANQRFVEVLLSQMALPPLREEVCECLSELVNKGMEPLEKTKLVESLSAALQAGGYYQLEQEEDVDFLSKFSRLLNVMGQSLVISWTRQVKGGGPAEEAELSLAALEAKVPLMLTLLLHDDDDISANIVGFTYDYLHVLKQLPQLSDQQKSNIEAIMLAVMKKLTYDDEYNFDNEGEEEAMFVEYRKQLKMLLDRVAQVSPDLLLDAVRRVFTNTMQAWQAASFQEVELAVRLLYMLGEALPASHGSHFSGDANKSSVLQDLMRTLVTCGVSSYQHSSVSLEFFETVVRYDKFFMVEPQHIPDTLMAFLDHRGLRHNSPKVRSRVSYLLSRFIKTLHKHMNSFVEDILTRIQDLLELSPPELGGGAPLTGDDQLFMFECAGVLIVNGDAPPVRKAELMRRLLTPLMEAFSLLLERLLQEGGEEQQEALADCLAHAVAFASRTSKAFSNKQTVRLCGCGDVYRDCLHVFLPALSVPVHRSVRSAVRSFLHRMVICLEEEVLPFLPPAAAHLLKDCEARDLQEFIPLVSQITAKFKGQVRPFLQQVFMPVVLAVFGLLSRPADVNDQSAALEQQLLRRSYFTFIQTVAASGMSDVIVTQGLENVERVVFTVIQGAVDYPDPVAQKTCFLVLARLVDLWGDQEVLPGFLDFIYKHIVPACFLAPLKPSFDLSDAQTVLTLSECSMTLKMIHIKRGPEFLQFLQQDYLPSLQLSPEATQELCQVLQQPDVKVLKSYMKVFFQRAKLQQL